MLAGDPQRKFLSTTEVILWVADTDVQNSIFISVQFLFVF